jgi:acyl CoA:acetate/3-ketoacid CoA transferase beta subunit
MNNYHFTPDDVMVVCISRQIIDYEVVVQGIATPLVSAAYLLARKTHAPNLYFASAIGQGICRNPAPLNLSLVESLWLDRAITNIGFVRTAADFLPTLRPKEFFRPGQVDQYGNFNNIAFGTNYSKPRLRLPGTGGIPDVTTFMDHTYLYVPRHSKVTFVPKLDFLSGLGHHPDRTMGRGPQLLISDLGQFDFYRGRIRLVSYHPGIKIKDIQRKTGFELMISNDVYETTPPTQHDLKLLHEEIDPYGIRRLERMSGASRRQLIKDILNLEHLN